MSVLSGAAPAAGTVSRRSGRPRSQPAVTDLSPQQEILDAAAALFAESGFAATTTRAIAERVGIRQASLYYHFPGKDEILLELLAQSVRPSLEFARGLEQAPEAADPATRLYALAVIDVRTLGGTRHNVGTLYLVPELQHERFSRFRAERAELQGVYGRFAAAAAARGPAAELGSALLGTLTMQLVESVIHLRRDSAFVASQVHPIAASCLRLVGLDEVAVCNARTAAADLSARAAACRPEPGGPRRGPRSASGGHG